MPSTSNGLRGAAAAHPRPSRIAAVAAALALALATTLTACSSSGSGASSTSSPSGGSSLSGSAAGGSSLQPVRGIFTQIYGVPSIGTAAQDLGIWKQEGLDVKLTEGRSVVQALVSNSADIAWSAPMPFIAAIAQGAKLKLIGSTSNVFDQYIIARKGLGVTSIDGLKSHTGLKVGITSVGASGNYGMARLAEKLGWTSKDYKLVTLGNLDGLRAALSRGTIDLFTWSAGAAFALRDSGKAVILGNLGDVVGPMPFGMLAASETAIKDKPESLKAFCTGYYQAQKTLKADVDKATQILIAKGGLDPKNAKQIVQSGLSYQSDDDSIPEESYKKMADATMLTVPSVKNLTADDVKKMVEPCSSL